MAWGRKKKPTERSDDRMLDRLGKEAAKVVCRARFVKNGKTQTCSRPKGHSGGHRQ